VQIELTIDTTPPAITVNSPADGSFTNNPAIPISGSVSEAGTLTIDGQPVSLDSSNLFTYVPLLLEGANSLSLSATDEAGNSSELALLIILDTVVPAPADVGLIVVGAPVGGFVTVTGQPGAVEAGADVVVTNPITGESATVVAGPDGSFSVQIAAAVSGPLDVRVEDSAGNASATVSIGSSAEPPTVDPAFFAQAEADGFIAIEIIPRLQACPAPPTAESIRALDLIVNRLLSRSLIVRNEISIDSEGCVSLIVLPRGLEILAEDVRLAEIVGAD
jgi:hypothetical protein